MAGREFYNKGFPAAFDCCGRGQISSVGWQGSESVVGRRARSFSPYLVVGWVRLQGHFLSCEGVRHRIGNGGGGSSGELDGVRDFFPDCLFSVYGTIW